MKSVPARAATWQARVGVVVCAWGLSAWACGAPVDCRASQEQWFYDLERSVSLGETRVDVAGPEPASFVALGVSPFLTGQALASSDIAFSGAQVWDDYGHPRAALGVDFAPVALADSSLTLDDYQHHRPYRFASRIQVSFAISKGESAQDQTTRFAPTFRIVFHEQRDPRVHRGPGSLQDCFERHVTPPTALRAQQAALDAQLQILDARMGDPALDDAERPALESRYAELEAQRDVIHAQYVTALQDTVRAGMKQCRDDPQVAAYTWNASGLAIGISPSFRDRNDQLGSIAPRGLVTYATGAIGFDVGGTKRAYVPTFFGKYVQVLGQVLYRLNEPLPDPQDQKRYTDADELVTSMRLRGGTSPLNADLELAWIHDWFDGEPNDRFGKVSAGMDAHLAKGTWLSVSVGRTFERGPLPDELSAGISIKRALLH
ncbi:hypothetical protein [Solimonas marina]|uniref:Uncharacterized protein n=1 Tax=Solimonas marina TaxID=2714601 RepID=A0A969W6E9_9GAMM|nr:hypothetical protein [Solimonas marina]NKF20759.1 hypothetical protein [Solimonas marina]